MITCKAISTGSRIGQVMKSNPSKCKVRKMAHSEVMTRYDYRLAGRQLQESSCERDMELS